MLLFTAALIAGLVALYFGAEWLVRGSVDLALRYRIRRSIIGVTIIALGTSMPEFVISLLAVIEDAYTLALGNIIGSNISNVGFIIGLGALLAPIRLTRSLLRREFAWMMGVLIGLYALSLNGQLGRLDGGLLVGVLFGFMYFLYRTRHHGVAAVPAALSSEDPKDQRAQAAPEDPPAETDADTDANPSPPLRPLLNVIVLLIGGISALAGGAQAVVYGGTGIAEILGVDELVVGLTVVAIGSSLPELAASLVSLARDEVDLSIGNIVGSNILNVAFVLGIVALVRPVPVTDAVLSLHMPVMLAVCAVLPLLAFRRGYIERWGGVALLGAYGAYLAALALPYL